MNSKSKWIRLVVVGLAMLVSTGRAATQYWDTDAGAGLQGGNGVWSTNAAAWSDSRGGSALSAWVPGNIAAFAAPSNGLPSLVTVTERFGVDRVTNYGGRYTIVVTNGGGFLQGAAGSYLGVNASNNTLIVAGGYGVTSLWEVGTMAATQGLTVAIGPTATNNVLRIDGGGAAGAALVTNVSVLTVGSLGATYNTLVITNGGALGTAGASLIGPWGTNNAVIVSGAGSLWSGTGSVTIGASVGASYNSLTIEDGGVVRGLRLAVGGGSLASGNSLTITRGGKAYNAGANVLIGNQANNCTLSVIGGAGVTSLLDVGGNSLSLGNNATYCTNNALVVDGAGVDGSAVVTNLGGTTSLYIGQTSNGATQGFNRIVVQNYGRLNTAAGDCTLGANNGGNALQILQGGKVTLGTAGNISVGYTYNYGAPGNSVLVSGLDSVLDLSGGSLRIGASTYTNNTVLVEQQGVVTNAGVAVSYGVPPNAAMANSLTIASMGKVYSTVSSSIGGTPGVTGNYVVVTDAGSLWSLGGQGLAVGHGLSTNNHLTLTQGGTVDNVGVLTNSPNNSVNLLGGTLGVAAFVVSNGMPAFVVGDGVQPATLKVMGSGVNLSNGVLVSANGSLRGAGIVRAGSLGVVLTNGATVSSGVGGPSGGLLLSGLTWHGGATNLVEVTNFTQGVGLGWDALAVSGALVLTNPGPAYVVRLDSLGAPAANFSPSADYNLRFLLSSSIVGFASSAEFTVDTSAFLNPFTGTWAVTNANNALYVTYRGSGITYSPTSKWNDPNTGNWSDPNNWAPVGQPVNDGTAALEFSGSGTPYAASNDAGTFLLNKLLLTASGNATTTNVIAGNTLVFTNDGARVDYSGSGGYLISSPLQFKTNVVFGGNGYGGSVVLSSNITATGGLTKQGPWTLTLRGTNSFGGPIVVDAPDGVLKVETTNSLGTVNDVVVSNGTFWMATPGDSVFAKYGFPNRRGLVTGAGAVWSNSPASGSFVIAVSGTTQTTNTVLTVTDGGLLHAGGPLMVGMSSPYNSLIVSNGGRVVSSGSSSVGNSSWGANNTVLISGSNSVWTSASLYIGGSGGGNRLIVEQGGLYAGSGSIWVQGNTGLSQLIVTNGGRCLAGSLTLANNSGATVGRVLVTGSNSLLRLVGLSSLVRYATAGSWVTVADGGMVSNVSWTLVYGPGGSSNGVAVTSGGSMFCSGSSTIATNTCTNNAFVVTGAGALWNNGGYNITLVNGAGSFSNNVTVSAGGTLTNVGTLFLATVNGTGSSNNYVLVDGGSLQASTVATRNDAPNYVILNGGGSLTLGSLVITNTLMPLVFQGGTLSMGSALFSNGLAQVVGDGVQSATLNLAAGATNTFAAGLTITNAATLAGGGLVNAATTVYGDVGPGTAGIGTLTHSGDLTFQPGATATFEIGANTTPGAGWDYLVVTNGTLSLTGCSLRPILTGGLIPASGDRYVIMTNAVPLTGSFANLQGDQVGVATNAIGGAIGYFRVTVASQYVALDRFAPAGRGSVFTVQ